MTRPGTEALLGRVCPRCGDTYHNLQEHYTLNHKGCVRTVEAVMCFSAGPGREQEAAEAWAFELTYYFTRGVGEQPRVEYADGVYTVTGLMTTTHPGDHGSPVIFNPGSPPGSLDFCLAPERQASLRELYLTRGMRFDGRDG